MRSTSRTSKARKASSRPHLVSKKKVKAKKTGAAPMLNRPAKPRAKSALRRARPAGGDSDRGFNLRFPTPEMKSQVQSAAEKVSVSMTAYVVAATLDQVKSAEKPPVIEMKRQPTASDRDLYLRFANPKIKTSVQTAAKKAGMSLNAYTVAATLDWVKQGKKPVLEMPAAKAS